MTTDILSSISGQFSKPLILGTLLPVVLFLILGMLFVVPLFPYDWQPLKQLISLDSPTLVMFTFVTIVLSGLLYSFNSVITRFYQGYTWQETWVGQWRIQQYKAQLRADQSLMERTLILRNELMGRDGVRYKKLIGKIEVKRRVVGLRINNEYPNRLDLVLPTRLGNVLRSFESYPLRQYNMAGISLWPRLRAKIDKEYAAAIDDAKIPLDFVINLSVLSALLSFAILIVGLWYPIPLASRRALVWGLEIFFFAFLTYFSYRMAIRQTNEWGNMSKSAFDLYRWELLKQFGYKQVPTSLVEERAMWGGVYRQMVYGDPPYARPQLEYATINAFAHGYLNDEPFMLGLKIARGVSVPNSSGVSTITLRVKNEDGQRRPIKSVVVRDTLPDGFDYIWDSARISGQSVIVSGANPFYFEIGDLSYGGEKTLTYSALQRKK